jgi:uncharacterized protein YegP (UPF0339 family)
MARFIVHSDKHGEFRWKLVGSDNKVIGKAAEGFKRQEDCIASLNLLQADAPGAALDFRLRNGVRPVTPARASAAATPAVVAAPSPAPALAPASTVAAASPAVVAPPQAPPPQA